MTPSAEGATAARLRPMLGAFEGRFGKPLLFGLLLTLFAATMTTSTVVNDVRAASAAAWNLGVNGTLDVAAVGLEDIDWAAESADGHVYTNRLPGAWLPAVPAYLIAPGVSEPVEEPTDVPLWPASLTAAAMVAGALVVLHEILRQELTAPRALGVTLVAGLGTSVWSVAADALWTHSSGVLVLALAMRALQRERWVLAGGWLGLAVTIRPTHAFTALGIGVTLAVVHRSWSRLVEIGVPSALGLGALALYTHTLFGTWLPVAGYDPDRVGAILGSADAATGPFTWSEQLLGTFFDAYHGVLVYSPFLAICVMFLVPGWRRSPAWARATSIAGLLYWVAQLRGNAFPGGYHFFAYRLPIEPLWLSVMVLAGGWFEAVRRRWLRTLAVILVAVSLALHAMGAVLFGVRYEPKRPGYGNTLTQSTLLP